MDQSASKRLKLYKMENEVGEESVGKDRPKKVKQKKKIKLEKSKTTVSGPSESVIPDGTIESALKNEQMSHLATKEEVKLLRTKLICLNSDAGELLTQLEEKEDEVLKVKVARDDNINMMKLYIAKKCREMEYLKASVDQSAKFDKVNVQPTCSRNVAVQTDMLELNSIVMKEEGECDDSPKKEVPSAKKPKISTKKIRLLGDISSLAGKVLKENTKLLQINDAVNLKINQIIDILKVSEEDAEKLQEDMRDSQAKVLRLTIENMRLKQENHKARGIPPP